MFFSWFQVDDCSPLLHSLEKILWHPLEKSTTPPPGKNPFNTHVSQCEKQFEKSSEWTQTLTVAQIQVAVWGDLNQRLLHLRSGGPDVVTDIVSHKTNLSECY